MEFSHDGDLSKGINLFNSICRNKMDGMICTFHYAKNKNNYNDSIRKLKKLEGYLKEELAQAGS